MSSTGEVPFNLRNGEHEPHTSENNAQMNLEHLMMLKKDGAREKGTEANRKELTLARASDSIEL